MHKFFLVISFFLCSIIVFGQSRTNLDSKLEEKPLEEREAIIEETKDTIPKIDEYKIYYIDGRIESPDTSLTIFKDYKFNFIRKDLFELLPFSNTAHTYNKLAYNFIDIKLPDVGARGKHFLYFEKEDIGYYKVATPFTEIFAKSTFEQGQILDFLVSVNLNPNYNFTLAHKGYKSLGKYVSNRSRGNQFRLSSHFNSKNNFTSWKFHFTSQNIFNKENGGLTPDDIYFFEQAPEYFVLDEFGNQIELEDGSFEMIYYDGYLDRSRLSTMLISESSLYSKRFFSDISRTLFFDKKNKNKLLEVSYRFTHEYKKINYRDNIKARMFDDLISDQLINDESRYLKEENEIIFNLNTIKLGNLSLAVNNINWENQFNNYESILDESIPLQINYNQFLTSLNWKINFGNNLIDIDFINSQKDQMIFKQQSIKIDGNILKDLDYSFNIGLYERSPNMNFYLNRSLYKNYNWYNPDLKSIKNLSGSFKIAYKEIIKVSANYNQIDNYTFFRETANALTNEIDKKRIVRVEQRDSINYLNIKLESKIDIGKFSFINTGMYQEVEQSYDQINDLSTLNVPEWITRNTIMYSDNIFNNSLFIQTGITFNYFTKFYADYYNPLISEFVIQNYKQIGDYPRFDFFFNAKIQQTRVFVKVEHLNSSFTGYDYYSDPFNPYRDLSVRLGLVWNFFQ